MRWHDVYIDSLATALGEKESTALAVAEGRYDAGEQQANGYRAVRVLHDRAAVESGVQAAELALQRSTIDRSEIVLAAHASIGPQGLEHFAPASYIQGKALGGEAMAVEIKQASNGCLAMLHVASSYLVASQGAGALLTTSDRFCPPVYDRYASDKGIVFGDGATGAVLSRRPGVARVLSTVVINDGTHGALYAGDEQWDEDTSDGKPVDLRARRRQYLSDESVILMEIVESFTRFQSRTLRAALDDAGCGSEEIRRWVFSNVGETQVDGEFRRSFGIDDASTTWEWGREAGHLGAGDQFAGLAHLLEVGSVCRGDKVALCGLGMGFSYGCAIVEIVGEPSWPLSTG